MGSDADPATTEMETPDSGQSAAPVDGTVRQLVVETRSADRWRVALCTDLADMDEALDATRSLHGAPAVDEVCLSLETATPAGRQTRREILRFATDDEAPRPAYATARYRPSDHEVPDPAVTLAGIMKEPAITLPDGFFAAPPESVEAVATPDPMPTAPAPSARPQPEPAMVASRDALQAEWERLAEPISDAAPASAPDSAPRVDTIAVESAKDDDGAPEASADTLREIRTLLASIYHTPAPDVPAYGADGDAILGSWLDEPGPDQPAPAPASADDSDAEVRRLEASLFARQSGGGARALMAAGALALFVLAGSLAELFAIDVTPTASAEIPQPGAPRIVIYDGAAR